MDLAIPAVTSNPIICDRDDLDRLKCSVERYGFGSLERALAGQTVELLIAEARITFTGVEPTAQSGELSYRARIGALGPAALDFLQSQAAMNVIELLFGPGLSCSPGRSAYAFYETGDHLGPHLDEPFQDCLATMIAYLWSEDAQPGRENSGLCLQVFGPELIHGSAPTLTIATRSGVIAFGRGSTIWHARPPLLVGEAVIALTACYGLADGS